ncbi:hypothetical protein BH20ACT13_BH20ACT13_10280 [soil metagenome]
MPAVVPAKQPEYSSARICVRLSRPLRWVVALLVAFVIGAVIFLLVAPVLAAFLIDSLTGVE